MKYRLEQVSKFRVKMWIIENGNPVEYMVKNRSIEEIDTYIELYGIDDYFRKNWIEPRLNLWEIM